ncbi:hypothetical protein D3C71_2036860 [compost metagenome]
MGAEGQFAISHALDQRGPLQLPVLAAGLNVTAGQTAAPVALVEIAVQAQRQLQQGTLQVQ